MEVLIAIIMLGLLASMALPKFGRAVQKSYERNAISQLQSIHASAQLFKEFDSSFPNSGGAQNTAWINNTFNLNIIEKNITFSYTGTATAFTADATLASGAVIRVHELPLSATNPCCQAGACLLATAACP